MMWGEVGILFNSSNSLNNMEFFTGFYFINAADSEPESTEWEAESDEESEEESECKFLKT